MIHWRAPWLKVALLTAFAAMCGSLYWSNVMGLNPCDLCWYERICMYPLVVLLGVRVWHKEQRPGYDVWPFLGVGMALSLYQYVIQMDPSLEVTSCNLANPCTNPQITWINGIVTPPLLAFLCFGFISVCVVMAEKTNVRRHSIERSGAA